MKKMGSDIPGNRRQKGLQYYDPTELKKKKIYYIGVENFVMLNGTIYPKI